MPALPHPVVEEWDASVRGGDPLGFPGYGEVLAALTDESVLTGRTESYAVIAGRFDVIGGSMGAAHGERVVRAYRKATELRLPVVVLSTSGGARMQEGMVSLVQLARTAAAAHEHRAAGLLSAAVLRSPTTGGVLASYASLTDVRAARALATIGFAGPRVVELTTGRPLSETSHTAESAYAAGLVDALLASEDDEAGWIEAVLGMRAAPLAERHGESSTVDIGLDADGAWRQVLRARHPARPTGIDAAARLCSSWVELRGADPSVRAGIGAIGGARVVVIASDRHAGDGRIRPEGYRLAQRAIALAGRLGLPLVTLVDTPGADPSAESEAAGIAREIAATFEAMAAAPVPVVSVCVGEGGSGGALALAVGDVLLIEEHAVFSVIAPEGAAAILERDIDAAPRLASSLKLTAPDLQELGIVDGIVDERDGALRAAVIAALDAAVPGERIGRFERATLRWLDE